MNTSPVRIGVLTVSDGCASGERADRGGPAVAEAAARRGWEIAERAVLPDSAARIEHRLKQWCDRAEPLDAIFTTGGTGLGPRDVTPEATRAVLDKDLPGFAERMRREGEKATPRAALSRAVCGARRRTLICNLPGSPKGAVESFDAVAGLIEHALEMLRGGGHP
ncbi:MAG: MogA/MoaB family molybdenum cofactor biosynthesis protein [Elusimicrobiota bacterium]